MSHAPWPMFYDRYLHTWNSVGAEKVVDGIRVAESLLFGLDTLLVVEQSSLESRPKEV